MIKRIITVYHEKEPGKRRQDFRENAELFSDIAKMDEAALKDEYGLKPYQIIDYKGLAGDKSDNIKGVEGVGDKTAVKLLSEYDTCEGIYENIEKIQGKLKEKLIKEALWNENRSS